MNVMTELLEPDMQDEWTALKFVPDKEFKFTRGEENGDSFTIYYNKESSEETEWKSKIVK